MKPAYNPLSRRQFLIGSGGFALPLPLLPSLLPGDARAQQAAVLQEASKRYFAYVGSSHAPWASQMFGSLLAQTPTETIENYAGFQIRKAPLQAAARNGGTFISDILQTRTPMSAKLLRLMNVINGLDMTDPVGHFNNAYCGAIGGNDTHNSIDQVMAASPKLFRKGAESQPVIVRRKTSRKLSQSSGFADETARSNAALFDLLFNGSATADQALIVDAVNDSYKSVRNDPQIATACKAVLDNFMDLMADTEKRVQGPAGSGGFARPTTDTAQVENEQSYTTNGVRQGDVVKLWNTIVMMGFASGQSRIFVWGPPDNDNTTFSTRVQSAWHNDTAHNMKPGDALATAFSAAYAIQFETGVVDLANQLDSFTTSDGKTLLDKGLVYWGWEMGSSGAPGEHHARSIPVVSIGNASGFFNTGLSVDYRNKSKPFQTQNPELAFNGLVLNQWLGMVLRSVGLTAADFAPGNTSNFYPLKRVVNNDHPEAVWAMAGTDLPFLRGTAAAPTL